jgi:hypothetical protein
VELIVAWALGCAALGGLSPVSGLFGVCVDAIASRRGGVFGPTSPRITDNIVAMFKRTDRGWT